MTDHLVQFYQRGGLWFAFLGVHVVALARDTGEWMSRLDRDDTWHRRPDLDAARGAIIDHVRQWYEAAHHKLVPGQAEQLCKLPRPPRVKEIVKFNPIDLEAMTLRLTRDGVVTTYVMPPVVDGVDVPAVTLAQLRMYCVSAVETAEHKSRAAPGDALANHELAVFAGLARLIDGCTSSDIIKGELKRIAMARLEAERLESTRVENDQAEGAGASA